VLTVKVTGTFVPGTKVRLGNVYLPPDIITATHDGLKFTVPAAALVAAGRAYYVGRNGREIEIVHQLSKEEIKKSSRLEMQTLISPYSDTQSRVKIDYQAPDEKISGDPSPGFDNPNDNPWVVVIGGKVFGLPS
jgi:hypothetical protein